MKTGLARAALLLGLALLALACAPAAPSPAPKQSTPPVAAKAAPSPAKAEAKAPQPWEQEWERVVAAAKKEGTVAVIGPTGADRRASLTDEFQAKYGISVEYHGDLGAGVPPKLAAEREAGQFLWDVFVGGTTTALGALIPTRVLDPLEPALILPEVKDPKNWRDGALEFVDEGRTFMLMVLNQHGTLFINPNIVRPNELRSYKDLLDPRFKGKLVTHDPRIGGPGQGTFTFFWLHPDLGRDYIRALARQELAIMRDYNQEIDATVRGQYLVLIGTSTPTVDQKQGQGLPIQLVDPRQLREGSDVSPEAGAVGLINRGPHPNAAKVYLNWLLTKEAQTTFAVTNGYISKRADVPTDHAPERVPIPGSVETYTQKAIDLKDELVAFLREVLGQ